MRYNWNGVIAAAGYMTDEPNATTIDGNGFSITRQDESRITVTLTEGDYPTPDETSAGAPTPTPENPNPTAPTAGTASVPTGASESAGEATDKPIPVAEAGGGTIDTVDTGQGSAVTKNVSTGQGTPDTGAVATGQ